MKSSQTKPTKSTRAISNLFAILSMTLTGGVMAQSTNDLGTLGGTQSLAYGASTNAQ